MLIQEASKWDIITFVLDSDEDCPAGRIATHFIKGSNLDYESVYQFGKLVDVLTFEIENVNIEALKRLKAEGVQIMQVLGRNMAWLLQMRKQTKDSIEPQRVDKVFTHFVR